MCSGTQQNRMMWNLKWQHNNTLTLLLLTMRVLWNSSSAVKLFQRSEINSVISWLPHPNLTYHNWTPNPDPTPNLKLHLNLKTKREPNGPHNDILKVSPHTDRQVQTHTDGVTDWRGPTASQCDSWNFFWWGSRRPSDPEHTSCQSESPSPAAEHAGS